MPATFKMPKTRRGARRQYDAIMRRTLKQDAGGLSFGRDWPTFRSNHPAEYAHVHAMNRAYAELPE